ncbi:exported hypothetical protein [uncultured Paludibacter sp.]|uniref:Secretion system C-terminal sorting domain-containing protein n=1 Tax=uncultured Paludibacter sp. TaxID=497635 RepID=A0A653AAZ0_9BACT|nr:exported hypothetical protein [uncultured Paludibacter sp.]
MKKIFLLIFIVSAFVLQAQISTPNGGFESWTTLSYTYPENYPINVNSDGFEKGGIFPLKKVAGYHGDYGVEIKSTVELGLGYFININPVSDDPYTWHGGFPYTQKPTGIRGYYKYNVASGDNGGMFVIFSKNGANIGTYMIPLGGLHEEYTLFDFDFSPTLTETPDSVVIGVASSWPDPVVGSILVIDSITFKGVASQPALMNGDFEQWDNNSMDVLDNWITQNESEHPESFAKTTDKHSGQYAVELRTYLGEEDNQPKTRAAVLMTGYYPNNCGENCHPVGGYPFTNQSDVLEFYYKYAPMGNDNAGVGLYFKKKDSGLDDWYGGILLSAASEYTYAEIPFNLSFVPDSVIVQINSSNWETISTANIGSTLKIDDICFRSQKTGLNNVFTKEISIYPNPTEKGFFIQNNLSVDKVVISDIRGAEVLKLSNINNYIDVSSLQKGIYLVQLHTKDSTYKRKLIKK